MCCIFHKQRKLFDESESENSSDSDSSSDEGEGGEKGGEDDGSRHNHHHHQHAHCHKRKEEKNAYERMPRAREKGKTLGECLCDAEVNGILMWYLGVNQV